MFSAMVVCIAPLFATKKNRFLYRLYLSYFFTRHEETKVTLLDDVCIFLFVHENYRSVCVHIHSSCVNIF